MSDDETQATPKTPVAPAKSTAPAKEPEVAAAAQAAPPAEESTYRAADLLGMASAPEIAGIFRETGKTTMTEAEFAAALKTWRGEA